MWHQGEKKLTAKKQDFEYVTPGRKEINGKETRFHQH